MKRLSHFLVGITYTVCTLAGESRDIPFEHMLGGGHSGIGHAAIFFIRAGYEFEEFWAAHHASDSEPPPVPDVDFEKYSVVAFLAGPHSLPDIQSRSLESANLPTRSRST